MAKKKLGMGTIEINKRFKSEKEAFKYANRLKEHIGYVCKTKALNGWYAQAIIIISNVRGNVSTVRYEQTGKPGRPKKKIIYNDFDMEYYNGNMNIEWHMHVLVVSKPSYAFRNEIKEYIDKNWNDIPNIYEKGPFDISKIYNKKVYKKYCNINIAEYFINQSLKPVFCDFNFTNEEPLKYTLKQYYYEYLKRESALRRLYRKNIISPMVEEKYLKELEKVEYNFKLIDKYFYNITEEQNKKEVTAFMKKVQLDKIEENYNKVQKNTNRMSDQSVPF